MSWTSNVGRTPSLRKDLWFLSEFSATAGLCTRRFCNSKKGICLTRKKCQKDSWQNKIEPARKLYWSNYIVWVVLLISKEVKCQLMTKVSLVILLWPEPMSQWKYWNNLLNYLQLILEEVPKPAVVKFVEP